ncbi:MAG: hypothetical protein M0R32_05750 [Candidatus Cloacimonetes bacterium]|jgi:hypothetical protein|nr:hypothetical protein [Candidatus Cloacimonadota bacterium]
MKNLIYILTFLFVVIYASAEDITTVKGKTYSNVTVTRVEPDGIFIKHSAGIIKLFVNELTPELQAKYKLSSDSAGQYQRNRTLALQQREIEMRRNLEARNAEWEVQAKKSELLRLQQQRITSLKNTASVIAVDILQITDDGCIAKRYKMVKDEYSSDPFAKRKEYTENIYIVGDTGNKVDGASWYPNISPAGVYTYTTVSGGSATIKKYILVN